MPILKPPNPPLKNTFFHCRGAEAAEGLKAEIQEGRQSKDVCCIKGLFLDLYQSLDAPS